MIRHGQRKEYIYMPEPKFNPGDKVSLVGESQRDGVIVQVGKRLGGIQYYQVFWGGPYGTTTRPEGDLRLIRSDRTPLQDLIDGHVSNYQSFLRKITREKLSRFQPLRNNIYAFNASRTRFYPYQFKPLMKLLDSTSQRLLICDEVGLGKTIESGLILMEMKARQDLRRVLIVCPSNLRIKWKMELKKRFGEDFQVLRSPGFMEFLDEFEEELQNTRLKGIVSIETLRSKKILDRIEKVNPSFDFVVVDEIHHMRNWGTKNRKVGTILSGLSSAMIGLTATPVHLGQHNLFSLLNVLDSNEFKDLHTSLTRFEENEPVVRVQTILSAIPPDFKLAHEEFMYAMECQDWLREHPHSKLILDTLKARQSEEDTSDYRSDLLNLQRWLSDLNLLSHIFTRTRKREVHHEVALRKAYAIQVEFNESEKRFYNAVTRYVRALSVENDDIPLIRAWRLNTPQRRMSSSIQAMVDHYRSMFDGESDLEESGDAAPILIEEFEDSEETEFLVAENGESAEIHPCDAEYLNLEDARNALRRLIQQWPGDVEDTKYRVFRDRLSKMREVGKLRVVVFAFFKATLRYLHKRLKRDGISAVLITGDTDMEERASLIERFRQGEVEVLLSSRVGSEGLDFQFCNVLFNYDMPWNPMELEQRIGRLDRIGQESEVIQIYNMWIKDSIEQRILDRLYTRIGIFVQSVGGLEPILGEVIPKIQDIAVRSDLTEEEREREIERQLLIVDKRKNEIETLEKKASKFLGTDAFFEEELRQIQRNRQYVTGEQLRRFVVNFLQSRCPNTKFTYDKSKEKGQLRPDEAFRKFLRKTGTLAALNHFFAVRDGVEVTFDSDTAFKESKLEFINILHPLVLAMVNQESDYGKNEAVVHHVFLNSDLVDSGYYLYFIFKVIAQSARSQNRMIPIFIDDELHVVDQIVADELFGQMLEMGQDWTGDPLGPLNEKFVREVNDLAQARIVTICQHIRSELLQSNELFIEMRKRSVEQYFRRVIEKHKKLEISARDNENESIRRLHAGRVRNLVAEFKQKMDEIEKQRSVSVEHADISLGILQVQHKRE